MMHAIDKIQSQDQVQRLAETEALSQGYLEFLSDNHWIDQSYYEKISDLSVHPKLIESVSDRLKVVYSPLHGTGYIPVTHVLKKHKLRHLYLVEEQCVYDPDFSTLTSANPEERSAFERAIELGKKTRSGIVLATDPDADRVGIGVFLKDSHCVLLDGNQIGVLLLYYLLSEQPNPQGFVVSSLVSTRLAERICADFGVEHVEVLTGFKHIAHCIQEKTDATKTTQKAQRYLFGFEESFGYNAADFVRDKDGISTCLLLTELAAFCLKKGQTLLDYLDEIYLRYGYSKEASASLTLTGVEGQHRIKKILKCFRQDPPASFGGFPVTHCQDFEQPQKRLPTANLLLFSLNEGSKIIIRPSGTEPKIKFYIHCFTPVDGSRQRLKHVKKDVNTKLEHLQQACLDASTLK